MTRKQMGNTHKQRTSAASCSKPLHGHDRKPLGARNHCSGVLRNQLDLGIAARASFLAFDSTRKDCPAHSTRNHCASVLGNHWALDIITAQPVLGRGSKPSGARSGCCSKLFCVRRHVKTPLQRSIVLGKHKALTIIGRQCFKTIWRTTSLLE